MQSLYFAYVVTAISFVFYRVESRIREISLAYQEIFKNKIESVCKSSESDLNHGALIDKIKEAISDACSEGKIAEM